MDILEAEKISLLVLGKIQGEKGNNGFEMLVKGPKKNINEVPEFFSKINTALQG